jgi:hypothetical protein
MQEHALLVLGGNGVPETPSGLAKEVKAATKIPLAGMGTGKIPPLSEITAPSIIARRMAKHHRDANNPNNTIEPDPVDCSDRQSKGGTSLSLDSTQTSSSGLMVHEVQAHQVQVTQDIALTPLALDSTEIAATEKAATLHALISDNAATAFSAAEWHFVSFQLAQRFNRLLESQIVFTYGCLLSLSSFLPSFLPFFLSFFLSFFVCLFVSLFLLEISMKARPLDVRPTLLSNRLALVTQSPG